MDEETLKNIVGQKITGSLGFMGGMLSKERLDAEERYKGEPYGDEMVGRSQVVSHDVAEAIDSMLPPLLKIFTSSDQMVRFDPRHPKDEQTAKQATEYVNWMWTVRNDGFMILHNWFKDALWKKLGVVKIYWEEIDSHQKETYKGLTDIEFQMIQQDDAVEVVSDETRTVLAAAPHIGVAEGALPDAIPQQTLHDVILRRKKTHGSAKVVTVPPEEFLIDHRAVTLEESPFLCHRRKTNLTELKEMGFDPAVVDTLGPDGAEDFNMERVERFKDEDAYPYRDDNYVDPSMREVWINECFMKIDYDGDGIAELRQIILAGESVYTLLENEEVDDHPFATLTPIPMPHKVYGMSIADQTTDLQRIKTALWRGALDSIYFSIAPQVGMVEGQVNLDDLLNRRPGGVVRMKTKDSLVPIPSEPLAQEVFTMVEYVDAVRESRTGVKRFASTLDPDQINPLAKTATAANLADNAANDRLALIARIFAETGIKRAFKRILELICKHQDQAEIIKLRGQFVQFDPREWTDQMDVSISVGLGTGNRDALLGKLMAMTPLYEQIVQLQQGIEGPLVTAENLYNFCTKLVEYSELRSPELYFSDPKQMPPQQPKPNPKMVEAQGKVQAQQAMAQAKAQQQQAESQADIQQQKIRAQVDMQLAQQKMQLDAQIDILKAKLDMQLQQADAAHQMQLERMRMQHETAIAHQSAQHQMAMSSQMTDAKTEQMRKVEAAKPAKPKDKA